VFQNELQAAYDYTVSSLFGPKRMLTASFIFSVNTCQNLNISESLASLRLASNFRRKLHRAHCTPDIFHFFPENILQQC
jgi:hypothetical protein